MSCKKVHPYFRNFKKKKPVSRVEQVIIDAPVPALIQEFDKIVMKKSNLSKHLREVVQIRVRFLIEKGFIKFDEGFLFCSHPFFDFKKCPLLEEGSITCRACEHSTNELNFKSPALNDKK